MGGRRGRRGRQGGQESQEERRSLGRRDDGLSYITTKTPVCLSDCLSPHLSVCVFVLNLS